MIQTPWKAGQCCALGMGQDPGSITRVAAHGAAADSVVLPVKQTQPPFAIQEREQEPGDASVAAPAGVKPSRMMKTSGTI